jgi:hypothetical protein
MTSKNAEELAKIMNAQAGDITPAALDQLRKTDPALAAKYKRLLAAKGIEIKKSLR